MKNELAHLLKTLKSLEVLEGDAAVKHLRSRCIDGDHPSPIDTKYNRYTLIESGGIGAGGELEAVKLYKTTPTGGIVKGVQGIGVEQAKLLAAQRGVEWRDIYADRIKMQWGSDQRVDRQGDIVMQDWDFTDFKNNPVMPFNHEWEGLPVGIHLDWLVTNRVTSDYTGPALLLTSLYAAADEMPPAWGDSLFRLISAGMLRANSVAFIPGKIIQVNDEEEREKLGLGRWGDILADNLLLENSPTLLGANQGAMVILNSARGAGKLLVPDMALMRELTRQVKHDDPDAWLEEDEKWRSMARMLFPSDEFTKATDVDEPLFESEIEESAEAGDEHDGAEALEINVEDLSVDLGPDEKTVHGEEMILAKLQQLISLVELGLLSLTSQLDSLADALLDEEGDLSVLSAEQTKAVITMLRRFKALKETGGEPQSFAADLAELVPSN